MKARTLLWLLLCWPVYTSAQSGPPGMPWYAPPNTSCETAIPICGSIEYFYGEDWISSVGSQCLWFTFSLDDPTYVHFTLSHPNHPIVLHNGCPDEVQLDCPWQGPTVLATGGGTNPPLTIQETLPAGDYYIVMSAQNVNLAPMQITVYEGISCLPCTDCLPPFELEADKKYLFSAWVSVPGLPGTTTTFTTPYVKIIFPQAPTLQFVPTGPIIDGWQKIEGEFTAPDPFNGIEIQLLAQSGEAYYDDVKVQPLDASMKCYVYDPKDLRFAAELDERHFATFYEYDGEGKLTRVKKETERGIMTIQETRYNSAKLP